MNHQEATVYFDILTEEIGLRCECGHQMPCAVEPKLNDLAWVLYRHREEMGND